MNISVFICIVSYIAVVSLCAFYPIRKKNILQSVGKIILPIKRRASPLFFAIVAIAPIIITLVFLGAFSTFIKFILCACAVLAVEITSKERISTILAGVYENALIADGKVIPYSEIMSLPTLAYEEDATVSTLKIVTKKEGEFFIGFENGEERASVVSEVLKQAPFLKPEE